MFKTKCFALIVLFLFFITACSSKTSTKTNNNTTANTEQHVETNQTEQSEQTEAETTQLERTTQQSTTEGTQQNVEGSTQQSTVAETQQESTQKIIEFLNSYTTNFDPSKADRIDNIKLASQKIDGAIIESNEIFSFNATVGAMGEEQGFKKATIYVDGKEEQSYGGGICQISTTILNAINSLGVEIVEQHHHSKEVPYVAAGMDAAVSYGEEDFKFKNINPYPLQLNIDVKKETLTVSVSKVEYK